MATLPTQPNPAHGAGVGAGTYAGNVNTNFSSFRTNDQTIEDRLESSNSSLFGDGIIYGTYSGALLAAGTGLAVNIPALTALIRFPVTKLASTLGGLQASSVNYVWLRQDGTYLANTSGSNPGSASSPAIALGQAVTNSNSVTSVDFSSARIITPPGRSSLMAPVEAFTAGDGGAWDALNTGDPATDRTGGTTSHNTITLSYTPRTDAALWAEIGNSLKAIPGEGMTVTGDEIEFEDGYKPVQYVDGNGVTQSERVLVFGYPT